MRSSILKIRSAQILVVLCMVFAGHVPADEIRIAVASNFSSTIKEIKKQFELSSGHKVILSFGSTGKHFAQITNGAPFEAFFAADVARPKLLEEQGMVQSGSRFTYAIGKVVLWSPDPAMVDKEGSVLIQSNFRHLSIANPKLAPYGMAAEQIMKAKSVWDRLQGKLVRGENINQAYNFVKSGNAEAGFIALSQIIQPNNVIHGSYWIPPQLLYAPIEQQAVLLRDNTVAREFLEFVKSEKMKKIIKDSGYDTP